MSDGLVTNVSLVVGVTAADPGRHVVILAGIGGLVAGAVSMAAGEYLRLRVQRELLTARIAQEQESLRDMLRTGLSPLANPLVVILLVATGQQSGADEHDRRSTGCG